MHKGLYTLVTTGILATASQASPVDVSPRPQERPKLQVESGEIMETATFVAGTLRPAVRPGDLKVGAEPILASDNARFDLWVSAFAARAQAQGISQQTIRTSFQGVSYDADVIRLDRNQSEFTKTIWDYLGTAVSDARIRNGKAALAQNAVVLDKIETKYGVDKEVVVAIWGLESAYGGFRGSNSTIQSLATLAFDARRADFFEEQLIEALKILQNGDVTAKNMTGSWAGAMGHTQFMPTSFRDHAVDFDGDGRRNVWSDDPTDALASTANYLRHFGWTHGQPWGVEVTLPKGFDYRLAAREITKSPGDWAALGVMGTGGKPVENHGLGSILLPAGGRGAAFMIFDNFAVIEKYNTADAYVIGVGHLADRIVGGARIQADWPVEDRALTFAERKELQQRLTAKGFDTQKIDGRIGPLTINAVRAYQVAEGILPDGYASLTLLERLR